MKKLIVVILFFVSIEETFAESLEWYEGSLVMKDGQAVVTGQLSVNLAYDIVLLKSGDQVSVFLASRIESVRYYDPQANINRKFTSIQQKVNTLTFYYLYEVVLLGEVSVLRKQTSLLADPDDDRDGYHYFVRLGDEKLGLHQFRSRVFPYLNKTCASLREYIHDKKLSPNSRADAIQIIDYYNRKAHTSMAVAMH